MPTSGFWRTMAKRFESLRVRYGDTLAATSCRAPLNERPATWSFVGSTRKRELERFELLAGHAALELECPARYGPVFFWLDCLKGDSPQRAAGPLVSYYDGYGGSVTKQYDLVNELFKASAEFCLKLNRKKSQDRRRRGPCATQGKASQKGSCRYWCDAECSVAHRANWFRHLRELIRDAGAGLMLSAASYSPSASGRRPGVGF